VHADFKVLTAIEEALQSLARGELAPLVLL